jgi:3-oxoacyl-[acyl-carrier protein] reductase
VEGRVAIVTGVGRTAGIGFALARRLLDDGCRVLAHSLDGAPLDALGGPSDRLVPVEADLADADARR